ncbi:hypothetical protein [Lactovum miscens]|uniref:DUF4352 domain-containing protein n=1 Tax=Lactovum miscens TaxID=190387 RepID=A0A841C960_9LACT|nr:hypothetical protein [Lactovum miscens]MBB5887750.1 hypothetical protein [Lactovum miscens]
MKKISLIGVIILSISLLTACGNSTVKKSDSSKISSISSKSSSSESVSSSSSDIPVQSSSDVPVSSSIQPVDTGDQLAFGNITPFKNPNSGNVINGMGFTVTNIIPDSKKVDDLDHMVEVDIEIGNNSQLTPFFNFVDGIKVTSSSGTKLIFDSGSDNVMGGVVNVDSGTNDYQVYYENNSGSSGPFKVKYGNLYWSN